MVKKENHLSYGHGKCLQPLSSAGQYTFWDCWWREQVEAREAPYYTRWLKGQESQCVHICTNVHVCFSVHARLWLPLVIFLVCHLSQSSGWLGENKCGKSHDGHNEKIRIAKTFLFNWLCMYIFYTIVEKNFSHTHKVNYTKFKIKKDSTHNFYKQYIFKFTFTSIIFLIHTHLQVYLSKVGCYDIFLCRSENFLELSKFLRFSFDWSWAWAEKLSVPAAVTQDVRGPATSQDWRRFSCGKMVKTWAYWLKF